MDEYLTVSQVAELLQLSRKTVYRLTQQGHLPGVKVGGSWRFRLAAIDQVLESRLPVHSR